MGLRWGPGKSLLLPITLPTLPSSPVVQNGSTPRLALALGCCPVVSRELRRLQSSLLGAVCLGSLEQTPQTPPWPDFIGMRPPPEEVETNEDVEKIQFLKGFG